MDPDEPFGGHKHREHNHRLSGVTNDDRVAELIEEIAAAGVGSGEVPFDCIITPLITGSPDYLEWVKLQTMKKDDKLAHYNIRPEDEIHGMDNWVDSSIGATSGIADEAHSVSNIPNNHSH